MDKRMFKVGFLVGILLIIGIGIYGGYFNFIPIVGDGTIKPIELAQLELENLKGEKITLKKGKPLVINFWATWCAPCIQEFPEFEELNKIYKNKIDFVMISDEDVSKIEKFKTKKGYTLNMSRSLKTFEKYGLMIRPATYIYDSEGNLVSKIAGEISKKKLECEIKKVIIN